MRGKAVQVAPANGCSKRSSFWNGRIRVLPPSSGYTGSVRPTISEAQIAADITLVHSAGAGKTKLTYASYPKLSRPNINYSLCSSSRVIDTLLQQRENAGNKKALAYFYCNRYEAEYTDPEVIMRTIVKQLSSPEGGPGLALRKEVIAVYEARREAGFLPDSLSSEESLRLIHLLIDTYQQTTIVIDALDECDPMKRRRFLDSLEIITNSHSTGSLVKIFVSSRDDNDIVRRLNNVSNIWIEAKDNQQDIQMFVREEVGRCIAMGELLGGKVSMELKEMIITTLTAGSHGMYGPLHQLEKFERDPVLQVLPFLPHVHLSIRLGTGFRCGNPVRRRVEPRAPKANTVRHAL